jgi:hypothetical protein
MNKEMVRSRIEHLGVDTQRNYGGMEGRFGWIDL